MVTVKDETTTYTDTRGEVKASTALAGGAAVEKHIFSYPLPPKPPALVMTKRLPLVDMVQPFVIACWEKIPQFAQYVSALTNKEAVTGWFQADRYEAAKMVLDAARDAGQGAMFRDSTGKQFKYNKIAKAIELVMKRLGLGKTQRLLGLKGQAAE